MSLDVRLIAATNVDLAEAVHEGRFREDLYYRLNVLSVQTPPLRECREDIPILARHFIGQYAGKAGITPEAEVLLLKYGWPGNVRQLQNVIQRAVVLGCGESITPEDLPGEIREGSRPAQAMRDPMHNLKCGLLELAFGESHGNYRTAAALLSRNPKNIHRTLRRFHLQHLARRK